MTNGALLSYLWPCLALFCMAWNRLAPIETEKKYSISLEAFFLIDDVSIKDRAKPLPLGLGLLHGRGVYLEGEEEDPKLGLPR